MDLQAPLWFLKYCVYSFWQISMRWTGATAVQSLAMFQVPAFLREKAAQYILVWHSEWVGISRLKTKGIKISNCYLFLISTKHFMLLQSSLQGF